MKFYEQEEKEFVRILIGNAKSKVSGIKKPIKVISVEGTSVEQMFKRIFDMIKKEGKKRK